MACQDNHALASKDMPYSHCGLILQKIAIHLKIRRHRLLRTRQYWPIYIVTGYFQQDWNRASPLRSITPEPRWTGSNRRTLATLIQLRNIRKYQLENNTPSQPEYKHLKQDIYTWPIVFAIKINISENNYQTKTRHLLIQQLWERPDRRAKACWK